MKFIPKLYHLVVPCRVRGKIDYQRRVKWYKLSRIVESFYKRKNCTSEEKESLAYLHKNRFRLDACRLLYLSNIVDYYRLSYGRISVFYDDKFNLPYIYHNGKRLYFPQGVGEKQIRNLYAQFMSEMDIASPHCYCNNPNELQNRVLFDCGVAEGLFPLTYVELFDKIVLFECASEWIAPLKATFEPYNEKVVIVNSFVSDEVTDNTITLDYYAETNNIRPTFIKMDIEGFEERALQGASKILKDGNDIICSVCTYHTPTAEENIIKIMKGEGFAPDFNNGFMFFFYEKSILPPYLRRGVVRFYKNRKITE